jgi:hypothetical protein
LEAVKYVLSKGGTMPESLDLNEDRDTQDGGQELDERDAAAAKEKAKDPDTLATPTELKGGGAGGGPGLHSGGPSET